MRRWFAGSLIAAVLMAASPSQAGDEPAGPAVSLQTAYQVEPILGAHVIRIRGRLDGQGEIELDPNACQLDPFGDPTACTRMASQRVPVEFRQAKVADPRGRDRRLYLLSGDVPEKRPLFLVMAATEREPCRLIVGRGEEQRRVLTLEPAAAESAGPGTEPATELCAAAEYSARQGMGTVRVEARGVHPELGWRVGFRRVADVGGVPQLRLECRRPEGMLPQAVTPFSVTTSWRTKERLREVVVHDARGPHRIRVTLVRSR